VARGLLWILDCMMVSPKYAVIERERRFLVRSVPAA
jgi:hypothetical protein